MVYTFLPFFAKQVFCSYVTLEVDSSILPVRRSKMFVLKSTKQALFFKSVDLFGHYLLNLLGNPSLQIPIYLYFTIFNEKPNKMVNIASRYLTSSSTRLSTYLNRSEVKSLRIYGTLCVWLVVAETDVCINDDVLLHIVSRKFLLKIQTIIIYLFILSPWLWG